MLEHAELVRKQIHKKESDRIYDRQQFFQEGKKLSEESKERREKLQALKLKKTDELRKAGISERYVAEVERKIAKSAKLPA